MAVNLTGYASVEVVSGKADPERPVAWRNIHELELTAGGLGIDAELVADAFAQFHRSLLRTPWDVLRVVVRSYAPDGQPYDPSTFLVKPVGLPGLLDIQDKEPVSLNEVLVVNRKVSGGRLGSIFLRGMLTEFDFTRGAPGSERVFTGRAGSQTLVSAAWAALQTALGSGAKMAMLSGDQSLLVSPLSREVEDLIVTRTSQKKLRSPRKLLNNPVSRGARQAASVLDDVIQGTATLGQFIEAFNAIPVLPDLPALP